ncbi:hypothetical protein IGI04_025434 [Brassica rapa subsp. trilocularis]|uniref:Uncharacterized protein n=1 Tax=Brassica rapa subsp. trilocularis TaxID=1813537 RepID=A0ABQ7KUF6_BRACM|nr:hypothetical protein IGI04_025434 [Brassica rapa subsp. trilocularis]
MSLILCFLFCFVLGLVKASNKKVSQAKRLKVQRESKVVKEESSNNRDFFGDQSGPGVSQSESVGDTKSEDAAVVAIGSVALLSQLQMTSKLMELFQMTLWCNREPGQGTVIQSRGNEAFVLDCLQKIKEENAQLEEPLTAEQELTKSYEASIRQLQKYLSSSKSEVSKVESSMVEALAATNSEVECTSLDQELQDMEVRARRGQMKSPDEPNQVTHIQAWQGEVDSARQAQRDAEEKLASAGMQQVRVEMVAMKRDAEHYGLVPQPRPKKLGIQWSDHDGLRKESNE